ncbi:thiamine pyrophosphate-binding protein, partial [Streptomyces parvus]
MSEKCTGGEALVAALRAHGADTVFGIPGTHNLPVYAALARYGLRHVSPRHEQGAGFAADG